MLRHQHSLGAVAVWQWTLVNDTERRSSLMGGASKRLSQKREMHFRIPLLIAQTTQV
jgi:hypothetical protein